MTANHTNHLAPFAHKPSYRAFSVALAATLAVGGAPAYALAAESGIGEPPPRN